MVEPVSIRDRDDKPDGHCGCPAHWPPVGKVASLPPGIVSGHERDLNHTFSGAGRLGALETGATLDPVFHHLVADATPRACVGGKYRPNRDILFQEDLDGQTF